MTLGSFGHFSKLYLLGLAFVGFAFFFGNTVSADAAWSASYWNLPLDSGIAPTFPTGDPDYSTTVSSIDFNWGTLDSPDPSISFDDFAAEYTSTITFTAGTYTFGGFADDGLRVYLDDVLIVDSWVDEGGTYPRKSGPIEVSAGEHDLTVRYYENNGGAMIFFSYDETSDEGDGTRYNPYEIQTCTDLLFLGDDVQDENLYYELTNDIDCSESQTWFSDGTTGYLGFRPIANFAGHLNGNNHTVSGFFIDRSNTSVIGLFLYLYGDVHHLHLRGGSIAGLEFVGSFAGVIQGGSLWAVSSDLSLEGDSYVGGLAGQLGNVSGGEIRESAFIGSITGSDFVAGLVAYADKGFTISDSYVNAEMFSSNALAGVVGLISFGGECEDYSVSRVYSTGTFTSDGSIGGIFHSLFSTCGEGSVLDSMADAVTSGVEPPIATFVEAADLEALFLHFYFDSANYDPVDYPSAEGSSISSFDSNSEPEFLKGNDQNARFDVWDFDTIWMIEEDDYPVLRFLPSDEIQPEISDIDVDADDNSAVITWETDEGTSSIVSYGPYLYLYSETTDESDVTPRVTAHSVEINDLVSCSKYYFRVISIDDNENQTESDQAYFYTTGCLGSATPISFVDQAIDDDGGDLTVDGLTITVPVDAVEGYTSFQAARLYGNTAFGGVSYPSNYNLVGSSVFSVQALTDPSTVLTSFSEPITTTFTYEDSDVAGYDLSSLQGFHYHDGGWEMLNECTLDSDADQVICTTSGFSVFGLFAISNASSIPFPPNILATNSAITVLPEEHFVDTPQHWAKDYINQLYEDGVIEGRSEYYFVPDGALTRAEATKMVVLAFDYKLEEGDVQALFPDTQNGLWFSSLVYTAAEHGIINGYGDGDFRPGDTINRAESLKMILLAAGLPVPQQGATRLPFQDLEQNAWYLPYVDYAYLSEIVNGKTESIFDPGAPVTRAEFSKMLVLAMDLVN